MITSQTYVQHIAPVYATLRYNLHPVLHSTILDIVRTKSLFIGLTPQEALHKAFDLLGFEVTSHHA